MCERDLRIHLNHGNPEASLGVPPDLFVAFTLPQIIDQQGTLPQSGVMTGNLPSDKRARVRQNLEKALLPILIFAPSVTVLCWVAAWIFRDEFIFKATLIGLGCFTIVVGAVACLLVLLKRIDRE